MMAEKREHACTWVAEEYDFVNVMVAACVGDWQRACPLNGPVPVLGDQNSCTEDGAQKQSLRVDASTPGYRCTLVRSLAQRGA